MLVARAHPLLRPGEEPVLDRIVVHIIEVTAQILFIPDHVIPETLLPDMYCAGHVAPRLEIEAKVPLDGMHNLEKATSAGVTISQCR
jgi:hypothetical protein